MASVIRSAIKMIKEKGISNLWKEAKQEGFLDAILDGNLMATKIHNIGATLVGVDKFGNKYYEKLENTQFGRHRWVEYADKKRYNASNVPPEWHGWLHFVTDHTADQLQMFKPKRYGAEHQPNLSGEGEEYTYHSKGHPLNPNQRDWTRYEPWQPTKA
uniref:NADH dehydrogenase [ubiquinone] 1 alpha subcomplex subunit 12 n=1 Tax=Araucaria cunninghamii TaxID=56994 RepID=A0A0D6R476_ARACU